MKTNSRLFGFLAATLSLAALAYLMIVFFSDPLAGKARESRMIYRALEELGLEAADWQTVVAAATADTPASRAEVWQTWARLEDWPEWSQLHTATHWLGEGDWQAGAQFEQSLDLGWLGRPKVVETVSEAVPGESVLWCRNGGGGRSCHLWVFESLPDGGTRISNVEVFHGVGVALVKPLVAGDWQEKFRQSVENLARRAEGL